MKLSTKLISSFSLVIIMLLLIGLASRYFSDQTKNKAIDESRGAVKELEIAGEMESYLYQSFINGQYYLNEPYRATLDSNLQDSLVTLAKIKRQIRFSLQGLNLHFEQIEDLIIKESNIDSITAGQRQNNLVTVWQLKKRVAFYNSLMNQLLSYDENKMDEAKQLLITTIEPYFRKKLLPLVDTFRAQIRTTMDNRVVRLNKRLNFYGNILLIATLLAFAISLIIEYALYESITTPIHTLAQAAREVGRGNLKKRITVNSNDEIGELGESFNRMTENLSKITFSKEYVDDIIESMQDALIVTDDSLQITKVNTATLNMLGYKKSELIGEPISGVFDGDNHRQLLNIENRSVIENYETRFKHKQGGTFPVSVSRTMIKAGDIIQSVVYVANDITERKRSERMIKESLKEKELLLSEIHHRVKNNLAVISGLLQMQRWETENETAQNVLQDSQLRVKSIALVHEKLYQSENLSNIEFDQYVQELIAGINRTFKNSETRIVFDIDVESLIFTVNQAIPCSLLLNEMIVNVHKHAFKNLDEGKVQIKMWEENNKVHLIVKDNGRGFKNFSNGQTGNSLGISLIKTLVNQLEGELTISDEDGVRFEITFKRDSH